MEKNLGSSWDSNHLNTSHTYSEYLGFESQLDPIIHKCLLLSPAAYDQPCIEPVGSSNPIMSNLEHTFTVKC